MKSKKRIRKIIRGYNYLFKTSNLNLLNDLKAELSSLKLIDTDYSYDDSFEKCLKQFLHLRLLNENFNKKIYEYYGNGKSITYPLPSVYRKTLKRRQIKVNSFYSSILWFFFQIKWYSFGVFVGVKEILKLIYYSNKVRKLEWCYFKNISLNNLPYKNSEYNLIGWYTSQKHASSVKNIIHDCKTSPFYFNGFKIKKDDFFNVYGIKQKILTVFTMIRLFLLSFFKPYSRLMLSELIYQVLIKHTQNKDLAESYFFHNSSFYFRPLWTYEAEKKGANVIFLQYSVNILSFKKKDQSYNKDFFWNIIDWSNYWLWTIEQKNIFSELSKNSPYIKVVGAIPFSSGKSLTKEQIKNYQNHIILFPVDPFRKSFYCNYDKNVQYYTDEIYIDFFEHIIKSVEKTNNKILVKIKRGYKHRSKKYLKYLESLKTYDKVELIDFEYSPQELIEKLNPIAVISMPYTSTAIIANKLKVPSIYYDSSNIIDSKHYSNNSIEVISTPSGLNSFLVNLNAI